MTRAERVERLMAHMLVRPANGYVGTWHESMLESAYVAAAQIVDFVDRRDRATPLAGTAKGGA